jgi:hypothetical protein
VDFEKDVGGSDDNHLTLRKVMQSKGLAGVFDHHFLEHDTSRKSTTTSEMEEQAKLVAQEAERAVQRSVSPSHDPFTPTWTGSSRTAPRRFGMAKTAAPGPGTAFKTVNFSDQSSTALSSGNILASLRQKNQAVESCGRNVPPSDETLQFADLLTRVKRFVRQRTPSTDDLLQEFDSVPSCDVAIFRRLLKTVASMDQGKWYIKE